MRRILAVVFGVALIPLAAAAETATLQFETQAIDLETGALTDVASGLPASLDADFHFAFNALRTPHAVLMPNDLAGVEIAFLDDTPFELISAADVPYLTFTLVAPDQPFDAGDTAVLKTGNGACFKVGNAVEGEEAVDFEYLLLSTQSASAESASPFTQPLTASFSASPSGLSASEWQEIRSLVDRDRYRIAGPKPGEAPSSDGSPRAENPAHRMQTTFAPTGVTVASLERAHHSWEWSFALEGYGYGETLAKPELLELAAEGNRIEYRRGELVEWYVNDERGLEQGFSIARAPQRTSEGPLRIRLGCGGSLVPELSQSDQTLLLAEVGGNHRLRYASLAAWDATGRDLPVSIGLTGRTLTLEVDDRKAVYPVTVDPTIERLTEKLLPSDGLTYSWYGYGVAVSGDTVLVGAPQSDMSSGAAYVFVNEGGLWTQQARLKAPDAARYDVFGESVSLWGDTAVIGAQAGDGPTTNSGAAYVFVRNGGSWSPQAKLVASDGAYNDRFGVAVSVWEDRVIVGANGDDARYGQWGGAAYVFERYAGIWTQQTKLQRDCGGWCFYGGAVAVSGDSILVASATNGMFIGGFVEAYVRANGVWVSEQLLTPSDTSPAWYGYSVALSGSTAVIGAAGDDDNGYCSGSAYVFVRNGGVWTQQAKLLPSESLVHGYFGSSVALSGDTALVGALAIYTTGSAFLFARSGTAWTEQNHFVADDGASGNHFGRSAGLSGDTAVIGAPRHLSWPTGGAAYTYGLLINGPPICSSPASVEAECAGPTTTVVGLDGSLSSDPDDDPLSFSWTSDCPGAVFDDATSATPVLTVDSTTGVCAPLSCSVTLTVSDDSGETDSCVPTLVEVRDTAPPTLNVDTTPIIVTDTDCSGDEPVVLPIAAATDTCDPAPVVGSSEPVTFTAGQTTTVTYTATDACLTSSSAGLDVTVLFGAETTIRARRHIVGPGTYPGAGREPLAGITVCAYDKSDGSCARTTCGGISHHQYPCILEQCAPVNEGFNEACCTTDLEGFCTINGPPGEYLLLSGDPSGVLLPDPIGGPGELTCGESKTKFLQQIVRADGKKMPGKESIRTGSELLIIEPEFVEWDESQETYPVVFESVGEWNAETSVAPPEGFVSDYETLSEQVDNEIEAVQFLLTDVGSDWVPTGTRYALEHAGRREIVLSRIGVRLSDRLAEIKGLDRTGRPLGPDGKPTPHRGFDLRGEWPAEIVGWIEPADGESLWTVKVSVSRRVLVQLLVTGADGRVVATLAEGALTPDEYVFTWDGSTVGAGEYFLSLTADELSQRLKLVDVAN